MRNKASPADALLTIPDGLRRPLIEEYSKIIKNYRERRWEPAELNGGKLSEVVYSILDGYTSGIYSSIPKKPANMVDACRSLENKTSFPRSVRILLPRLLISLYEIRNNRSVGHIGGEFDPNHMDATIVLSMAKWIMGELVRVFHNCSIDDASEFVETLTERHIPLIWNVGERVRVLSSSLSARDKMLVVLYSSVRPVSVRKVVESIEYNNISRFRNAVASQAHVAGLIDFDKTADELILSPLGIRWVENKIELEL